jgi:hypothetical protein
MTIERVDEQRLGQAITEALPDDVAWALVVRISPTTTLILSSSLEPMEGAVLFVAGVKACEAAADMPDQVRTHNATEH